VLRLFGAVLSFRRRAAQSSKLFFKFDQITSSVDILSLHCALRNKPITDAAFVVTVVVRVSLLSVAGE